MNDFSEIENELKKLQPVQPSSQLFAAVEQALAGSEDAKIIRSNRFLVNWAVAGFGLAAAAVFLLLARVSMDRAPNHSETVAQIPPATQTRSVVGKAEGSTSDNQFIPASATEVVYNALDEGLRFVNGSEVPMRRLRCQTHETLEWHNPRTGESLRVSYPSEEVILFPISGQ
jgi:hypothetical protein